MATTLSSGILKRTVQSLVWESSLATSSEGRVRELRRLLRDS